MRGFLLSRNRSQTTFYDYQRELDRLYHSKSLILPFTSIDTHLLVSDMQLTLPNTRIFAQATLINEMLKAMGTTSAEIGGRRYTVGGHD